MEPTIIGLDEAVQRPGMRFVPIKTGEQQSTRAIHRRRSVEVFMRRPYQKFSSADAPCAASTASFNPHTAFPCPRHRCVSSIFGWFVRRSSDMSFSGF